MAPLARAFPVAGRDEQAAQSFWGATRDAGRRSHQGVDIFAPRGTPVVAATAGVVTRVGQNALGGNVIFLVESGRRWAFYYAHLDRQLVAEGTRVAAGDTLGLVGNTGNARSGSGSPRGRKTNGHGSTAPRRPVRYTPKCRCGGVLRALPVFPTSPSVSPAATRVPSATSCRSRCA